MVDKVIERIRLENLIEGLSKEDALCSIEIHKNLAPRDAWADGAGYRGNVGEVKAITYHKSYGEISRNIFKIDMLEDYK